MTLRLLPCAALALLTGCVSSGLTPMNPAPLPAHGTVPTVGGYELSLDLDGTLVARPAPGDLEAALGASLAEVGTGVVVTGLIRAETPLLPGDRLLRVHATNPVPGDADAYADQWPTVWQPIRRVEDLHGYDLAWSLLQLEVEREGDVQTVEVEVGRAEAVATRQWEPETTNKVGFRACRVSSLPLHLRPAGVEDSSETLMVTYVATGSTFGVGGLRPLQVLVSRKDVETTADGVPLPFGGETVFVVVGPDGELHTVRPDELTRQPPTDLEILWVLTRIGHDPSTTRVLVGPSGWIYHHRRQLNYNPRTDRYGHADTWSLATGVASGAAWGGAGRGDGWSLNLGLAASETGDTEIDLSDDGWPYYDGPLVFDWEHDRN